jgi:arginyl-tRNA synthetase
MVDRQMPEDEKRKVAEQVGVAAIKYSVLRQTAGKNIIFDPEKSLSFEGDSGPYLQYSCVRAKAVLAKAKTQNIEPNAEGRIDEEQLGEAGIKLGKLLVRYPETLERSWKELAPHHIAIYLTELAGVFNSFYAATPIVNAEDKASNYKVALTQAFATVMENGLNVLGITVPLKM